MLEDDEAMTPFGTALAYDRAAVVKATVKYTPQDNYNPLFKMGRH